MIEDSFVGSLGLIFDVVSGDAVRGSMHITSWHQQGYGIVHGGIYCTVVEHTASVAAGTWFKERGHVVGVSNSTVFIRAARSGRLRVEASPLQRGRTQQLWQVFITDEQDRLVAKGEVRFANVADAAVLG